jgi:hypothetical protein
MPLEFKGVSELAQTFGVIPAELKRALKPAVLKGANLIGEEAKGNASFSSYIPGAVSVSASFSQSGGGAVVKVAERGYPHAGEARVYEGNGVSPSPFLHPTYGRSDIAWSIGQTHPFLGPAVEEKEDEVVGVIAEAVAAVARSAGL